MGMLYPIYSSSLLEVLMTVIILSCLMNSHLFLLILWDFLDTQLNELCDGNIVLSFSLVMQLPWSSRMISHFVKLHQRFWGDSSCPDDSSNTPKFVLSGPVP